MFWIKQTGRILHSASSASVHISANVSFFLQVATESMSSIRTVASLGKEEHFVNEYKKLTDIPYKWVLSRHQHEMNNYIALETV